MPSVATGGSGANLSHQSTAYAEAAQFFLKNVYPDLRNSASELFGKPESLHSRLNVFGQLMRTLIPPSRDVEEALNWVGAILCIQLSGLRTTDENQIRAFCSCRKKHCANCFIHIE
ncbi:hypothetical protein V6N12_021522 [Hibiscus sabdariffa]|uniref:Uncharacterized protein n=1 Tax=Hibiscus sabdariffa TaxID=183260 RepID=A0ABR2FRZ7_9ROSI